MLKLNLVFVFIEIELLKNVDGISLDEGGNIARQLKFRPVVSRDSRERADPPIDLVFSLLPAESIAHRKHV